MSRSRHKRGNPLIVFAASLLTVALIYYLNEWTIPDPPALPDFENLPQSGILDRGKPTETKAGKFTRLDGCQLIENDRTNDGDSFLIRHGDSEHHFRIYFVDCPEKYRHEYNAKRLAEQGAYFSIKDEETVVSLGERARDSTLHLLRNYPFSIYTIWESVYNSERSYAFVEIADAHGKEAFLHEILVGYGLARIHTKGIDLPDGKGWREQRARLQQLEQEAAAARRGAWGTAPAP